MKKIRILAVNDPPVYAYLHDAENGITKKWEAKQQVKVIIDIIDWDQYKGKLDEALYSQKSEYDIVMNPGNFWLPELVEEHLIIPLDEELKDYDLGSIIDSIKEEMKYKNQLYMIPSFSDGHILFYRKDKLAEKGITVADKSISISGLKNLVHQFEEEESVIALKADQTEILPDVLPFLWGRGVELLDKPPYLSNIEQAKLALEDYLYLKNYCPKGIENYGNLQVKEAIQNGEVAIGVSWGGQAAAILNPDENPHVDQIGFLTYDVPCNTTWGFVVASNSKNIDVAIDYLKYVTNQENDKLVGRISGGPVRKTTYLDSNERQYCPWYDIQFHMLNHAKQVPKTAEFAKNSGDLYSLLHRIFTNEISLNEFFERLKADN
ncbi:extracellular solute-binding protein [Tepidibacillus marianensis]|uniref:ABC transporter substrate-binding protein n=1 Tax=Tepidibacillus marianensis TaxID=3131995 RepID=UPI0030D373F9